MAQQRDRQRATRLRTWSAFGDLGRRPSEYEILTHGMNHTMGATPLELPPDAHGNRWLREHRDGMALTVPDWDAFRDPDRVTYGSYVAMQDDRETYVEGLLERFDKEQHDERLTARQLDLLALAFTPARYLVHGQQMLSAYLQQLAPGSYIATCAAFQTADQLRRVQLLAYRTTQLARSHPDRAFTIAERTTWENHPDWQPFRRAVEEALVAYDWDLALVAFQLVVKPVADAVLLHGLARRLDTVGVPLDSLITDDLWRDAQRSARWTRALLEFLSDADPGNRAVLQGHLDTWAAHGTAMAAAGARLIGRPDIEATALDTWDQLLSVGGLARPRTSSA
ncbi:toluene hydroxylase [Streptomyces sp. NPDC050508]|uniref:toluene hydroxylase n=1 Tax=Streptomyces sp. NPDC050508 TaxID=3155405 RepID=UPI00343D37A1